MSATNAIAHMLLNLSTWHGVSPFQCRTKSDTNSPLFSSNCKRSWPQLKLTSPKFHVQNLCPTASTVSFSLPIGKPGLVSSKENLPKWSLKAIKSFTQAETGMRKLNRERTGSEGLVLGILNEGTSFAAKFLRANGIMLSSVRDEIIRQLGEIDEFNISPPRPPLTEEAQRALDWAVDYKLKSGDSGEITTSHLLLGIWSDVQSHGHKILAALGFNDEKAKAIESAISQSGILDC